MERLKKFAPNITKKDMVTGAATVGVASSVAFILLNAPADLGLFVIPEKYTIHATGLIIWIWNRTLGRKLLS